MLDRRRILVIEDDPKTRNKLAGLLTPEYDVTTEARAQDAIEDVSCLPFDLVILDLDLPGLYGEEALLRIRALPDYAMVPIIGLSAHPELRTLLRGCGIQAFIDKPIVPAKVREAIPRLLRDTWIPWPGKPTRNPTMETTQRR